MARKSLDKWIDEAMTDSEKPGPIRAFVLMHVVNGLDRTEVHSSRIGKSNVATAREFAKLFRDKAETYAQDMQTTQTFALLAIYENSEEPLARLPFTVQPQPIEGETTSEPPTEAGRTAQAMRHYETGMNMIFRRQATQDDHAIRTIENLSNNNDRLMRDNMSMFDMCKTLIKEATINMHEMRVAEIKEQRKTELQRGLLSFAPALANTITGRELFPQSKADTALLETIAMNLDPEMIGMIGQFVKPELAGPLTARLLDIRETHAKKQAELKRLSIGSADDSDITGEGAGE